MTPDPAINLVRAPDDGVPTRAHGAPAPGLSSDSIALARRIWRDHRRWVAAILLAHKPRDVELDDLLQTVALQVVRHASEIRGGDASLKPWLRTVAVNAARAAGRATSARNRNLRLVGLDDQTPVAEKAAASDPVPASIDRGRELLRLASQLPEKYREPLLLRCVKGMSYRQIGEVTGLPETTIETRIARGRRMLREIAEKSEAPLAHLKKPAAPAESQGTPK